MADSDRYSDYVETVRRVLGPSADKALNSPAWTAMGATLRRAQNDGHDVPTFLSRTLAATDLSTARDVAALLTYRMQRELTAPAAGAAQTTLPPSAARRPGPTAATIAEPAAGAALWRERPFGALSDEDLATETTTALDSGRRGAILARAAEEKAATAIETARSRSGPAARAVEERYREMNARVDDLRAVTDAMGEFEGLQRRRLEEQARLIAVRERLSQRSWLGLRQAVRGQERGRLMAEEQELDTSVQTTIPVRLAELDRLLPKLEHAAGPAVLRAGVYREWELMTRTISHLRDTARTSDVADAQRQQEEASRLKEWASDQADRHASLEQEAGTRATMTPQRAAQERAGREAHAAREAERAAARSASREDSEAYAPAAAERAEETQHRSV
ncbi:hypothetical protein ACFXKW_21060 [Streptomyces sp. NPDC059193]|uniref:hypothetical protein n=1 Tax=Streptomyces sp. NPDC059193 TaxID=3346763 RepID=UPI0036CACB78